MRSIDLNADLGESYGVWRLGDDEALLDIVTSANVACGFHAGDPSTIRRTCESAVERGVAIGAQVSYPDLLGFGRRHLAMSPIDLRDAVIQQIGTLEAFARVAGGAVTHLKPHGALYHTVIADSDAAAAVVQATVEAAPSLTMLGAPGSALLAAARAASLPVAEEAFADRAYLADGRLVGRDRPGAVLHDADVIAARVVEMVVEGRVASVDGGTVEVRPESVCVHGDTADAVAIAGRIRDELDRAGVEVRPFAPST
ncbi:MAG: 5-oxoprolinase subunit PxpA [Actinomycetota bacterium]